MSGSIEPPTSSRIGVATAAVCERIGARSSIVLVTQDYKKHEIVFPLFGSSDGSCGARPKWDFPPSCAELTGGSAPSPVAALIDVAETATAKTGGIRHGARKLLINVHTKTRNPF